MKLKHTLLNQHPISVHLTVSKDRTNPAVWLIEPSLKAFPITQAISAKNIVFILDTSSSMEHTRLSLVKIATKNLLSQLASQDTFSIVSFNNRATCWVNKASASPSHLLAAKNAVDSMMASDSTNFNAAFSAVKLNNLIPDTDNASIIFLTDGENTNNAVTLESLIALVAKEGKVPRIIPIGIGLEKHSTEYTTLCNLAKLANKDAIQAIFIHDETEQAYLAAFQNAFDLTCTQSKSSAIFEVTITAKDRLNPSKAHYTRVLNPVQFDGNTPQAYTFYFESPVPPTSCQLKITCDGISARGAHRFQQQELNPVSSTRPLSIAIRQFQWKDNTLHSWLKCAGSIAFGLAVLASSAGFVLLALSPWNMAVTLGISMTTSIMGLALLSEGCMSLLRKTVLLPTSTAESKVENNARFTSCFSAKPSAKMSSTTIAATTAKSPPYHTGTPSNYGKFSHAAPIQNQSLTANRQNNGYRP